VGVIIETNSTFTSEAVIERQILSIEEAVTAPDHPGWRELTSINAARLFERAQWVR
jgi:hypothetical protein